MKKLQFWNGMSIRRKAMITQIFTILFTLCICIFLIFQQFNNESHMNNAAATYQYDRYIIQNLDTNIRQLESMSYTIAGNKLVRTYVELEPGAEQTLLYETQIQNLLHYTYNRYLPTNNVQLLPGCTLDDISTADTLLYSRTTSRMWTFSEAEDGLQCMYYYQFFGDDSTPALLVFTPSQNMLTDLLASISSINGQQCALYSDSGTLVCALPGTENGAQQELIQTLSLDDMEGYTLMGNRYAGYRIRCEKLPFVLVSIQSVSDTWPLWSRLLPHAMLCLILIVGCSFLSNRTFYSNITRRILQLAHACENLTLENVPKTGGQDDSGNSHLMLKQQLTVPVLGEDEIGRLSVSINNMLTRITELTDQNEQEVMAAQKAAYDMLAAQIHPHFIYNTLENLRMMAEMNDDEQVADLLYALGKMLRLSITDATSTGELSMEIEHAQMYLKLQQMRLNDKLSYVIEPVSPEIIHTECPRFLLQPLVENAIKHGFQQKKTPGNIIISSGVYEHGIYLRVWDDGIGFSTERLQQIQQELRREHPVSPDSHGIGLLNVHSRLRMFYGPGAGLTIESVPQQGTTCTLWLANH